MKREVILGKGSPVTERFLKNQLLGDATLIADKLLGGVLLDGRPVEGTLPMTLEGLLAGQHTVVAADTLDGARWGGEVTFHVEAGQTQVVRLHLRRDFQPTVRASTGERVVIGAGMAGQTRLNSLDGAELVYIPGGTCQMGSNEGDDDEKPVHEVTVQGFWMYKCEVTVAQYSKFCQATGADMPQQPDWNEDDHPVVYVSWEDAQAYCEWAQVRLPTEAEWEYAARGGKQLECGTATGELSHDLANYRGTEGKDRWEYTSPVGSFPPNPFGVYDMAGNVWEWCQDWYGQYPSGRVSDPQGSNTGEDRVLRGGGWYDSAQYCCSANRFSRRPGFRRSALGFRLVLAPPG